MKRFFCILVCVAVVISLCACNSRTDSSGESNKIKVVCTIFPQYDFVRQIAGDLVDVKLLIAPDAEVHGYEPSLSDLKSVHECDLFIYCSGESESWSKDLLGSAGGTTLDICEGIELIPVDESHEDEHHHSEHIVHDEHVWTSPANAKIIVKNITEQLVNLDENNADDYENNSSAYTKELDKLDARFQNIFSSSDDLTLIFADRFPFRYLTEQYNVDHYAAFTGCSSETEPTLSDINELIKTVEKKGSKTVFYVEMSDQKTADIVCGQTGCDKRMLHSCHNLTRKEFESGDTYLTVMNRNADVLEEVLNQ